MPIFFCANRRCTGNYTSKFSSSKQLVRKTRKTCSQTRLNNLSSNCINSKLLIYSHISACFAVDVLIFASARLLLGFGIENYSRTVGSFSNDDGDGNENAKKAEGLISKTTTLHVQHTFLVHFSAVSARLRLENAYYGGRKQATTNFSFSFQTLVRSPRNQLHGNSATFDISSELE